LDTRSGEFKFDHMSAAPGTGYPYREPGSDVFYIAGRDAIYRYHWRELRVDRLTRTGQYERLSARVALDATHVYFGAYSLDFKPLGFYRIPR
jgi:hypothetical protein